MVTCGDKSRYTWMIVDQAWIRQEGIPGNPLILFGLRKLSAIWFCCNLLLNNRYLSQLPFELSAAAVFVLRGSEQASTDADCTETDRISLVQGEPSITFLRSCSFFWELNFKILAAAGSCRSFLVALVGGGVFSLDAFEANFFLWKREITVNICEELLSRMLPRRFQCCESRMYWKSFQ